MTLLFLPSVTFACSRVDPGFSSGPSVSSDKNPHIFHIWLRGVGDRCWAGCQTAARRSSGACGCVRTCMSTGSSFRLCLISASLPADGVWRRRSFSALVWAAPRRPSQILLVFQQVTHRRHHLLGCLITIIVRRCPPFQTKRGGGGLSLRALDAINCDADVLAVGVFRNKVLRYSSGAKCILAENWNNLVCLKRVNLKVNPSAYLTVTGQHSRVGFTPANLLHGGVRRLLKNALLDGSSGSHRHPSCSYFPAHWLHYWPTETFMLCFCLTGPSISKHQLLPFWSAVIKRPKREKFTHLTTINTLSIMILPVQNWFLE